MSWWYVHVPPQVRGHAVANYGRWLARDAYARELSRPGLRNAFELVNSEFSPTADERDEVIRPRSACIDASGSPAGPDSDDTNYVAPIELRWERQSFAVATELCREPARMGRQKLKVGDGELVSSGEIQPYRVELLASACDLVSPQRWPCTMDP